MSSWLKKLKAWWKEVNTPIPVPPPPVDQTPDTPPPADPPTTNDTRWTVKLRSKLGKETKGSGLIIHPDGRVIELVYDNKSRRDTWLRVDGKQIAHIGCETANAFTTPGGRTWISVEMGTDGEPAELIGTRLRGLGWSGHYMGCGVALGGKPYFLDLKKADNARATVRDERGSVLKTLTGSGIPYDVAVMPDGSYAVSLCDGRDNGISFSTGQHIKCDARGLIVRAGSLLAGVKGELVAVSPSGLELKLTGKLGDSIDSLAMDAGGNLWISASNPDSLYVMLPDNTLVRVASFADAADGGALFRSRVACGAGRVVWGINRRADNHWETYDVVRDGSTPSAPPAPDKPTTGEAIDWSAVHWMNGKLAGYAVKAALNAAIGAGKIRFMLSNGIGGNGLVAVSICRRDGQLYGGSFDGVGADGSKTLFVKSLTNMGAKSNTKGGPYWAGSSPADRKRFRPIAGETMWVAIVDKSTQVRTTVAEITWKE